MSQTITPFLMFDGNAEQAVHFYVAIFEDAEIRHITRYGPGEQGAEGSVQRADFRLAGRDFIAIDSPVTHAFGFTPALSLFVDFDSEAALDSAYKQLAEGGRELMPLDDYGFSRRFGWLDDRFGVSWQLNLA